MKALACAVAGFVFALLSVWHGTRGENLLGVVAGVAAVLWFIAAYKVTEYGD